MSRDSYVVPISQPRAAAPTAVRQATAVPPRVLAHPASSGPAVHVGAERETLRPFATLGEQLAAVARAATPGVAIDPRLHQLAVAAPSGLNESVGSEGGFMVQPDLAADVLMRTWQSGQILRRVRRVPLSETANGAKVSAFDEVSRATGSRLGGVRVYWAQEADTVTPTKPKFRQVAFDLKKLIALAYLTDEIALDSPTFNATVTRGWVDELTVAAEDAIVNGAGAGQPLGITKTSARITQPADAAQPSKTISTTNIAGMYARCYLPAVPDALVFLCSQDTFSEILILTVGAGNTNPMLYDPRPDADAPYGRLVGRPILPCEYCATLGTEGDIILTDLDQYAVADRQMQAMPSLHVKFLSDETAFRIVYRIDGQPIWTKAVTPKNGGNAVSPYVTLAARP